MSEEILRALMQLFAILAKQDTGVGIKEREYVQLFLSQQLDESAVKEYLALFDSYTTDERRGDENKSLKKLTSVKDSVKIIGICRKINRTLHQKQKVVVLVRLFELIYSENIYSKQQTEILNTIAEVFNINKGTFLLIDKFVKEKNPEHIDAIEILYASSNKINTILSKHINIEGLDGMLLFLRIQESNLYFLKYTGSQDITLNGLQISNSRIYIFAEGSVIRTPKAKPLYYSDVISHYLSEMHTSKLLFDAQNIVYRFPTGEIGLHNISISETEGKLVGIMGTSGAGKTTLLNVLTGISIPESGTVLINNINIHTDSEKLRGVIGYIPQDDLLIEDLTVFENLFFNAKLCFSDKSKIEIIKLVNETLLSLGLYDIRNLKVGTIFNKMISGGQRKRLNIALELIRQPSVLFVDEPTSGLSSRDSENVMDLLRELALKGKLIFVVIHQPSSDIYKMFDNVLILDYGGYMIYFGNPVEAITYFKKIDQQINHHIGECQTCGNVNPELIFNIVEAKIVDEFGHYTQQRKISPEKWETYFREQFVEKKKTSEASIPKSNLRIPKWIKQIGIFITRDFISKVSNQQYVVINLIEAPLLGFILSFIIRYIADPESNIYIFRENENIPSYIFMCIIVALFLGLTVSAEEIFRDRKILKRESFLNLSRSAYLLSKIAILFSIAAIQAFLFLLVGNSILAVKGMLFHYWFVLFTVSAFANIMGLIISSSFNSAVTIYILIPLLLIPQMILGGAMFSFAKLNRVLGTVGKVPLVAEFMASRWAYEALMVNQFINNDYETYFYDLEKQISISDYKQVYYIPELIDRVDECMKLKEKKDKTSRSRMINNFNLLSYEISKEQKNPHVLRFNYFDKLTPEKFTGLTGYYTKDYLRKLREYYRTIFEDATAKKERIIEYWLLKNPTLYKNKRNAYTNESIEDIVKRIYEKNKIIEYGDELIQQSDPIFLDPIPKHFFNFRTHFLAPRKYFAGELWQTYWFNMIIIWFMSLIGYIILYYNVLLKTINFFNHFKIKPLILKLIYKKHE